MSLTFSPPKNLNVIEHDSEVGDAAQMTMLPGSVSDLCNVLASGTKNDTMNERKQVIQLGFRTLQLQSQNKLDDRQVEGYHGIGISPLSGKIGSVTVNFSIKGRCPPSI
jgi:hypothetical protein